MKTAYSEIAKIAKYIIVGGGTTILTFVLIIAVRFALDRVGVFEDQLEASAAYFIGSFIMIGVSLFLHRKITFNDLQRTHKSKVATVLYYYALYTTTSIITTSLVYVLDQVFSNQFEIIIIGLGLIFNVSLNYIGQRYFIFTRRAKQ